MSKIILNIPGEVHGSVVSFVSWQRLLNDIKVAIGLRSSETVTHLEIEEAGVNVYLRRIKEEKSEFKMIENEKPKRRRKTKKNYQRA